MSMLVEGDSIFLRPIHCLKEARLLEDVIHLGGSQALCKQGFDITQGQEFSNCFLLRMFWSISRHLHVCLEGGKPKCPDLGRPKVYIGRILAWWGLDIQILGLQLLLMPWLICVPPSLFVFVLNELVPGLLEVLCLAWPMSQLLVCIVFAVYNHVGLGVTALVYVCQLVYSTLDAVSSVFSNSSCVMWTACLRSSLVLLHFSFISSCTSWMESAGDILLSGVSSGSSAW